MHFFTFADIPRLIGDGFHLYSIILLIQKIKLTRSCSGLSLKTQFLYLLVFLTRYVNLIQLKLSEPEYVYNFVMKLIYIGTRVFILYLIRMKYYYTYDKRFDKCNTKTLLVPSLVIPLIIKQKTDGIFAYLIEYLWNFSVVLESIAILPQLILLRETGEAEVMTSKYVFFLGMYRLMYVVGWINKWLRGIQFDFVMFYGGILQTLLYVDFFYCYYVYIISKKGPAEKLPY
ncbi:hypothetical protein EDEG_03304 [Edhazardia aedis USNM 41457]|uniref:ER lumen protein-retaining receptor n=1 Tax=Edhazardia aedis (strain USNM 41457) TaxID=1003232 RepID=J9D351_EDHAE|nr:hypothetical protein EDEG_03304 [Edhazardia aedis USNM 41457]|eukprot:EJW02261.1 hypothetical protein EDEG_03304 [Edhazardia aedis USNM 41457]